MSDKVVIEMTSQEADAIRGILRVTQAMGGFGAAAAESLKKVKKEADESKESFAKIGDTVKSLAAHVVGFTSVAGGVLAVTKLLRAEWDAVIDRMKEAAGRQVDVSQSFRRASTIATDVNPNKLYEQVVRGANGVDPRDLFLAIESGISASGNISQQSVIDTTVATAKIAPHLDSQSRSALITSALTWQKQFKVKPEEALAGVIQSNDVARTEELGKFAQTLAPAVAQLHSLGGGKDSFEFLMSELSAFGMRAGDPTGKRTATNYINLARQYKERAIAGGHVDKNASLEESLEAVRNDPKIQQLMLTYFADSSIGVPRAQLQRQIKKNRKDMGGEEMSVEARTFVAAMETIQGDQGDTNLTAEERRSARGKLLGLTPAAVEEINRRNQRVEESKYSATAEIKRASTQATAQEGLLNSSGGMRSAALDAQYELLRQIGVGPVKRGLMYPISATASMFGSDESFLESGIESNKLLKTKVTNRLSGTSEERDRHLEEITILIQKFEKTLAALQAQRDRPQEVVIAGDRRADVPQGASASRLND